MHYAKGSQLWMKSLLSMCRTRIIIEVTGYAFWYLYTHKEDEEILYGLYGLVT